MAINGLIYFYQWGNHQYEANLHFVIICLNKQHLHGSWFDGVVLSSEMTLTEAESEMSKGQ